MNRAKRITRRIIGGIRSAIVASSSALIGRTDPPFRPLNKARCSTRNFLDRRISDACNRARRKSSADGKPQPLSSLCVRCCPAGFPGITPLPLSLSRNSPGHPNPEPSDSPRTPPVPFEQQHRHLQSCRSSAFLIPVDFAPQAWVSAACAAKVRVSSGKPSCSKHHPGQKMPRKPASITWVRSRSADIPPRTTPCMTGEARRGGICRRQAHRTKKPRTINSGMSSSPTPRIALRKHLPTSPPLTAASRPAIHQGQRFGRTELPQCFANGKPSANRVPSANALATGTRVGETNPPTRAWFRPADHKTDHQPPNLPCQVSTVAVAMRKTDRSPQGHLCLQNGNSEVAACWRQGNSTSGR